MRSTTDIVSEFVDQWVEKAEEDLGVANMLYASGAAYYDAMCFHCQQAAEKYLKALLVKHQVEFSKTHDIAVLLRLAAGIDSALAVSLADAATLTRHAVDSRYPEDVEAADARAAERALELANMVRNAVRAQLDIE